MKAIVLDEFGGPENFRDAIVNLPPVKGSEVLVAIKAAAFNPIDYQMRRGSKESKLLKSNVLGRELSGTVAAVGPTSTRFKIGDSVAGYIGSLASNGSYAEYAAVPELLLAKVPTGLTFAEAAALPMAGMTALQCYDRMKLSGSEKVFISGGSGAVGSILLKLLIAGRHEGKIITTAGSQSSKSELLKLGLSEDSIVNYRDDHYHNMVLTLSGGANFDCCIDLAGGESTEFTASILKVNGTYVNVTNSETETARELLFDNAATILNVANYAYVQKGTQIYGEMLSRLFDMVTAKVIAPLPVLAVGPLSSETVIHAHELLEDNRTSGKKLIMENNSEV